MKRVLLDMDLNLFRLALLEDGEPVEFYVESKSGESLVGNIYVGNIVNVIPNLQAAFIDIGVGKNAYWYYGNSRATSDTTKENRPKTGESIVVQVEKDAVGTKGAVLTQQISFAGKFLVLLPQEPGEIGISRKITQEQERANIRELIKSMLPESCGVIVRTNGAGRTEAEFRKELTQLLHKWEVVSQAKYRKAPALLWKENEPALKAARDFYTADVDVFSVNDAETYAQLKQTGDFDGENQPSLELYEEQIPLFSAYYAESKMQRALSSKVWLKSGGYLVIEETEACVVIDVNSAKAAGRGDLEKVIYKTNLEAAKEAARQMRLRNLSGIIIIDFIDMVQERHRIELTKELTAAVAKDRIKVQVVGMTELGLMQVTRKKTRPSLQKQVTAKCRSCEGSGRVMSIDWIVAQMHREAEQICASSICKKLTVFADERLLHTFAGEKCIFITRIMEKYGVEIVPMPEQNSAFGWYKMEREA